MSVAEKADVVISQPILNDNNPLYIDYLSKICKEIVYLPYVFVDGIFSLSSLDIGSPNILGSKYLEKYLDGDIGNIFNEFLIGNIDFCNEERLSFSIQELFRREKLSDSIPIADVISDNYRKRKLMISHNHPEKWLMDILCARLFDRLGWNYIPYEKCSHRLRVDYMFTPGEAVLSPYDADKLGVNFPSDDQWWGIGHRLINRIWDNRLI